MLLRQQGDAQPQGDNDDVTSASAATSTSSSASLLPVSPPSLPSPPAFSNDEDEAVQGPGSSESGSGSNVFPPCMELQIRTQHMDDLAEAGEASHSSYKGGLDSRQARQLREWTHQLRQQLAASHGKLRLRQGGAGAGAKLLLPPPPSPLSQAGSMASSAAAASAGVLDGGAPTGGGAGPTSASAPSSSFDDAVGLAAKALFSNWDADGNGVLSMEEVKEQLRELGAGVDAAEADAGALMELAMGEEGGGGGQGQQQVLEATGGARSESEPDGGSRGGSGSRERGITLQEFSRFVRKVGSCLGGEGGGGWGEAGLSCTFAFVMHHKHGPSSGTVMTL